ncbi:MAG: hypothetical protein H6Q91_2565 [Deltaproteobacteria bacterium]|nr:hypothetical protein [Deltaproteobacteria bacterium]
MNPRTTGILFLVAVLLGGLVWYSNHNEADKQEAEAQAKLLFGDLKAESVEWVELRTSDGKDARLERKDGAWHVTRPVEFPADGSNADAIASALAGITSEGVIEEAQGAEVYGLGEGARVVRFRAGGADQELRTGKKTPIGANNYVATGTAGPVYTVASFRVTGLEKSLDDLRERRPLRFDRGGVQRIEVNWVDGGVVLEKKDGKWRMLAPLDTDADAETIETLLSDLVFLRASGFVDAPPPDKEVGLDAPQYRVVLVDAPQEGREPMRHELRIGALLDAQLRAARGAESALYQIPNERFDKLPKTVVAFRFKSLGSFVATDAQRFEISYADPSARSATQVVTITGENSDAGWTTKPEAMAPGLASRLVAELARLDADDIAAEKMGGAELAAIGLAPPHTTLRVFGAAPAGDGEAPELAKLIFGVEQGDAVFAQVPGRETVYRVSSKLAEHVPISLEAFRNRFVAKEPPTEAGAPDAAVQPAPSDDEEEGPLLGPADAGEAQPESP